MSNIELTAIEKTLSDLIAIKSTTNNTPEILNVFKYIKERFKNLPIFIKQFDDAGYPILLVTTRKGLKPKTLLMAHADVLPASGDMFNMRVDEDKIYGRGAWDMKFAIAGYIELFIALGNRIKDYDVGILITSDEETRNKNVSYVLSKGLHPENIVLLDGSTDWQLETSAKGALTVKITTEGKATHGSTPWEGESASFILLDVLNEIRELFTVESPLSDTLNISFIKAGDAVNQLPVSAHAYLDMRFTTLNNQKKIQSKIEQLAEKIHFKWEIVVDIHPIFQYISNPYLQKFALCTKSIASAKPDGLVSMGASEASCIVEAGIPCIVTRPKGGGHHSDNEWIDRKSLSHLVPIIERYINHLDS